MSVFEESEIQPGTVLDGKYRIERQIGAGGMGAVFEATHTTIGRRVAIKTLHLLYSGDEELVKRFHREAQMAGSIGHDNICEVTDLGSAEDGSPYLVMPLLTGGPLADLLTGPELLPIPRLIDITAQTLSALDAAHQARIVHRDLKPDNIFVTKIGDRKDFVKLLDFGISKLLDQDAVLQLTQTGTVLGTPFYMAPEQAKGSKQIDHRVDLYAVGVILYEALTGQRPFIGDTYNEIMYKIIAEPFPRPGQLNPQVPPQLEQIVLRAMAREADNRYASAEEMRRMLAAAVAATPLHIQIPMTDSMVPPAPSNTQANEATISATALESVSTGVRHGSRRKSKLPIVVIGLAAAAVIVIGALVTVFIGGTETSTLQTPSVVPPAQIPPAAPSTPAAAGVAKESPAEPTLAVEHVLSGDVTTDAGTKADKAAPQAEATTEAPAAKEIPKKSVAKKGPKKASKSSTTAESKEKPTKESKKKVVKGRFGTTFVGDYDD